MIVIITIGDAEDATMIVIIIIIICNLFHTIIIMRCRGCVVIVIIMTVGDAEDAR